MKERGECELLQSKEAEKQFSSKYQRLWKYPEQVKRKLLSVENFFQSADSLADIAGYPPFRFHKLLGDRKGEWSVSLGRTGYRVTVVPCDDEGNEIVSGDIPSCCREIRIVEITEVSNHYE